MCGITGFICPPESESTENLTQLVGAMTQTLVHRGPDDDGTWCDAQTGVAFGHRRLSIVDLSEQGHQPMLSSCGKYVIVYNGEIYNCNLLREELKNLGKRFRGHSDTEVLLEAIAQWGLQETLCKIQGMFAFALWDRENRTLSLARDRVGIKPLYYGTSNRHFFFASELKAFKAHPEFRPEIEPSSVALLMRHNYIPAPFSIYKNTWKLPPGTFLTFSIEQLYQEGRIVKPLPKPIPYWQFENAISSGKENSFGGSYDDALIKLERLLQDAVSARTLSDVPLGAFLSGGIDSSLVVAMMQKERSTPVKTFTIGFSEYDYDESPHARRISEHLGTNHTELCVTPNDSQSVIPLLANMFDEPFSDMSQIPTYLVSKLARNEVTVSLSGDGGDELFGGYHRYFHIGKIWKKISKIPFRPALARLLQTYSETSPLKWKKKGIERYAQVLQLRDADALYSELNRHWNPSEIMALDVSDPSDQIGYGQSIAGLTHPHLNWMALDTLTYLPDDILTKVDRASMAVSLEARVPLLDHRLIEFAWSLPSEYRFQPNRGKRILHDLLEKYVPRAFFDRPKTGFGVPIGSWLRGSLQDWAESLLAEESLNRHGLLNTPLIRQRWAEHSSGKTNWQYPLWDVLMFQAWYNEQ